MPQSRYKLGCPVWGCKGWAGKIYPKRCKSNEVLEYYSKTFNTVEGNTTFYHLPTMETTRRWATESAAGFQFAFKFPKTISHDKQLIGVETETQTFLEMLRILAEADRLGPTFLQLSQKFSARQFLSLETYLRSLPREFPFAVEVRHSDWFDEGKWERRLDELLMELEMDRVLFDTRGLFSARPSNATEEEAQGKKPRTPYRTTVTGKRPMLRMVMRDDVEISTPWYEEWGPIVAGWIERGLVPYVFTHSPDDALAPEHARRFHEVLQKSMPSLEDMPPWLGEGTSGGNRQLSLF